MLFIKINSFVKNNESLRLSGDLSDGDVDGGVVEVSRVLGILHVQVVWCVLLCGR